MTGSTGRPTRDYYAGAIGERPRRPAPPPLFGPVPRERRGARWWLGWLLPVIAAHRLCSPTRPDRIVDPLVARVRLWRTGVGFAATVGAWLGLGLVAPRDIPAQLHENFRVSLSATAFILQVLWLVIAMVPSGHRWPVAVRARGSLVAFLATWTATATLMQTSLSQWPPASPAAAAGALWLALFSVSTGLMIITNGVRTADLNDALPAVVSVVPILPVSIPLLADAMYDRVSLPLRLLIGLIGPVTLIALARWELRRLRRLYGIRLSDLWRRP
ncbi:hypothetical protein HW130_03640 [Streptomyces sp. PKU-EA00015]|uniref:hypothetical protein n=1 Tax=Streptomyces sp. PKU-EA00015 TaxID=2748326 RepID=UPI0015A01DE1|nr:hypothetical protein [Streptomyces sp. PKU-EA00015]NWF25364.1 hypothetical protein [Streptomyces sp. PKU-EA00015]